MQYTRRSFRRSRADHRAEWVGDFFDAGEGLFIRRQPCFIFQKGMLSVIYHIYTFVKE
jgi:hypothetical protein